MESRQYSGPERRRQERITIWLRRALVAWIIAFSLLVGYAIREARENANTAKSSALAVKKLTNENQKRIAELEKSKAQVTALQSTNCGLTVFLLTARKNRWQNYENSHSVADYKAVLGYERLIAPFMTRHRSVGTCPIPKRVLIPDRPLDKGDR